MSLRLFELTKESLIENNNSILGTRDSDIIAGDINSNLIYGYEGDDTIAGGAGDDTINGGEGNDVIFGDNYNSNFGEDSLAEKLPTQETIGNDVIHAGNGNDTVYGSQGDDTVYGGLGDDSLRGNAGNDLMKGNEGNDFLNGQAGNDILAGGAGDDMLKGEKGDDHIEGGDGNDGIWGGAGNDTLKGGNGNDVIDDTEGGNDCILGGEGNDTLYAGDDQDTVAGGVGDDKLFGDAGNDIVAGGAGNDEVNGGKGDDILYGDNYISNNGFGENLVVNGSFEDYTVTYNHCYAVTTLNDWTTQNNSGIDIKTNNYYRSAADGDTWIELEGYGNSSISQQIDTEAGKQYQISFDYKGHSKASAYNNTVEVYWNGKLIDAISEQGSKYSSWHSKGSNEWKTYTYTVEAGSADLTGLTFKATGSSYCYGGQLDDIEVREIYEDDLSNKLGTQTVVGHDKLNGGDGNDTMFGGAGWDTLFGGAGKDVLNGTDGVNAGYDQKDRLNGGLGADTFVLGDSDRGYYNSQGWSDFAVIEDFNVNEDTIQLHGSSDNYWLGSYRNGNSYLWQRTEHGWDGVAMFENVQIDNHTLDNSESFQFA
ncbi:MAG: DUF642 domain-containing protein [Xenococcaceae cyanobacterium MO_234.B1]|nr:DUF642 domain-containing protein [Xenococcaceae cyanobacterium MO_234.B1]